MSWIEEEANRQARFNASLGEAWAALKAALARDLADYASAFGGLYDVETKDVGDNGYRVTFHEGSDRLTARRDIHLAIDFKKLELTAAVAQTHAQQIFKIVPDDDGLPIFELRGKRYTVDEVSREILKPHLSKVR